VPVPLQTPGPVRLDGGDVLKVGHTAYVGTGGRTTEAGAEALAHHLAPVGLRVETVPVRSTLHLKSQVTALPDGTVVGYPPLVDDAAHWEGTTGFLAVPEEDGAHVIVVGDHAVLLSDAAPRTAELYAARGLTVVTVPTSEITKLEGCVTCLSVRLHPYD
jgi:dimethylargininase